MNISISESARNAATRCRKKFSCLKKGKRDCCDIEDCINDSVLFVKSMNTSCPYQEMFGNEFICNCPVRKELYVKYRI